jgi:4-carboxymuconolactone decarboxylase
MAMTETARRNHDRLFPNLQSSLKAKDPEFIELWDNFAFDEVLRHGSLDERTRLILIVGSTIASHTLVEFKLMAGAALEAGVTPVELKEVVYQSAPYAGIAKVVEFLRATNELLESRGIALPLAGQSTTAPATRREKGLAAQKAIFGDGIEKNYRDSPKDLLHVQDYLSANCFGDFYTRAGLDLKTRELLTFALILSLGGCEPQLKAHVQGNLNVGNGRQVLIDAVTQLLPYAGYPRTLNAIRCINEVVPPPAGT